MTGFLIFDLENDELTAEESEILTHPSIAAVILFARNYTSPEQLQQLTHRIHTIAPSKPVFVDQEGGRVQRFREGFTELASMEYWGQQYDKNPDLAEQGLSLQIQTMIQELQQLGVNASLMPVLDLNLGVSDIIGERSLHQDPKVVTKLSNEIIKVLHEHNSIALAKHFPGHGGVRLDSHKVLPVDKRSWNVLYEQDMLPYRRLLDQLDAIMPAHIIYSEVDSLPTTFSSYWLKQVLRKQMKFKGAVISDDLSMEGAAMMGGFTERAEAALDAGCDLLSVCNNRRAVVEILDRVLQKQAISEARVQCLNRKCYKTTEPSFPQRRESRERASAHGFPPSRE